MIKFGLLVIELQIINDQQQSVIAKFEIANEQSKF